MIDRLCNLAFVIAMTVVLLASCTTGQRSDVLRSAINANNASVRALAQARTAHEGKVVAEYLRRSATCPTEGGDTRRACVLSAGRDTLSALAPDHVRLLELELLEHTVAAGLEAAAVCQGDRTCEASALAQIAGPLARLAEALAGGSP